MLNLVVYEVTTMLQQVSEYSTRFLRSCDRAS